MLPLRLLLTTHEFKTYYNRVRPFWAPAGRGIVPKYYNPVYLAVSLTLEYGGTTAKVLVLLGSFGKIGDPLRYVVLC